MINYNELERRDDDIRIIKSRNTKQYKLGKVEKRITTKSIFKRFFLYNRNDVNYVSNYIDISLINYIWTFKYD